MKKTIIMISCISFIAIVGLYLNWAYARIYRVISDMHLIPPTTQAVFELGGDSTTTLTYIALGDSLTAGTGADRASDTYAYRIADHIAQREGKKIEFINLGQAGAVAKDVVDTQLPIVLEKKPAYVTVLIGVNDVHMRTPIALFKSEYEQIIQQLSQEANTRVAVISIPYIGAPSLFLPPYQLYFDNKTRAYNAVIKDLANAYSVQYIDLYRMTKSSFMISDGPYAEDLFHPASKEYYLWAQYIYANFSI